MRRRRAARTIPGCHMSDSSGICLTFDDKSIGTRRQQEEWKVKFKNARCEKGEVLLGDFEKKEVDLLDAVLLIRQEKAHSRGVICYYYVYVQRGELMNYLKQAEEDLAETQKALIEQMKLLEEMRDLYHGAVDDEEICDELCLGVFANVCAAKKAFPYFESIRGGGFVRYELRELRDEKGAVVDQVDEPLYYFFVERKEYEEFCQRYAAIFRAGSEDFAHMQAFYDMLKSVGDRQCAEAGGG